MTSGKRKICRNFANEQTLVFQNADGAKVELTLGAYNDGVAFRYRSPQESQDRYTVTGESTGFRLPVGGKVWAHPYDNPTKYTLKPTRRIMLTVSPPAPPLRSKPDGRFPCWPARATEVAGFW